MKPHRLLLGSLSVALLSGCSLRQEPNPNDPNSVNAVRQPRVLKEYMQQLSSVIQNAVLDRQITKQQADALMVQGAHDYMAKVNIKNIPNDENWMVAEAYIAGHDWKQAQTYLGHALKVDNSADRVVNDTLRYARCCAELGQVDEAIKYARQSFSAPSDWKWPILYAVYLEIVPAAEKTQPSARLELAKLTEDAIRQHQLATGSTDDPTRRDWFVLRDFHINKAWDLVVKLYNDAGRPDLAKEAMHHQMAPEPAAPGVKA